MNQSGKLILALPKGRVLKKFCTLLKNTKFNLVENPENTRKILLKTKSPDLQVLIIRGWDVPIFVSSGVAHLGVVGKDILLENNSEEFIE
ncbi:MAG: ATP phosphoribosyltransferase, partial [Pseudomonadota bacterium]|nr:ATP phosphoribosyltransferase [Pseudomonadota bacterium]